MPQEPTLKQLKVALRLQAETITSWARTLRHPETGASIDPTNIYKAIKYGSPAWVRDEIIAIIQKSRSEYPDYYERMYA